MNPIHKAVDEYVTTRRALGFQLTTTGAWLEEFASFLEQENASRITAKRALQWAQQPSNVHPAQWAARLGAVRGFARYYRAIDPRTEIPPEGTFPNRYPRPIPYIYKEEEIGRLVEAARQLDSKKGLRAQTHRTFLGLLAVTGLRVGEGLALNREDVDLDRAVLCVRQSKFGKSRWLPLHVSTGNALEQYRQFRDQVHKIPRTPAFFVSEKGTRLNQWSARENFVQLSKKVGLRAPAKRFGHGPRLHDFRHSFAVRTLLRWYRQGQQVDRSMFLLSTYLGHVHPSDTYWYLSAVPELMELARHKLEQSLGDLP